MQSNTASDTFPPTPRPAAQADSLNLLDYWRVLGKGRWTILAVFVVVVGLVALWTFTQTPIYKAVATVEVRSDTRRVLPGQDVSGMGASGIGWTAEERFYNTQIEILGSRDLAQRVLEKEGLASDPMFAKAKDPVAAMAGMIRSQPRTDTGIIEISVIGTDPVWITRVANAVAKAYQDRNIEKAKANLQTLLDETQRQVAELYRESKAAEMKKFEEAETGGLVVTDKQRDVLAEQLGTFMVEKTKTQIKVAELQSILRSIEEVRIAGGDPSTIPEIASQEPIAALIKQRSELEKEIEGMRVTYLPSHPQMMKKTTELDAANAKLGELTERSEKGYRADLGVRQRLVDTLDGKIVMTREQLLLMGRASSDYQLASQEAQTKARIYETIQTKANEMGVTQALLFNNINLLDKATVPSRPIRPRKVVNLFLGAICGLLCGVGVVFLVDHLNNTIRSIEDVEQYLKLPVLSVIPRFRETTSNAVKEAFQTLRTNVLFSSDGRRKNLLLLTSAGPREGKSSTVFNLARTIASAGERILVVDCDLRRPTAHLHFEVERDHGLTNYLMGSEGEDIGAYIKTTKTPNLFALTCGPIPPNPPELFSTERFRTLLHDLRKRYDWVIVDSPPVISLTDSVILASMADIVALVVKHNESEREMIRRSLQTIRNVNPHVIGAILNNVDIEKSFSKDYYYAGYYNYSAEGDTAKKKRGRRSREVAAGGAPSA